MLYLSHVVVMLELFHEVVELFAPWIQPLVNDGQLTLPCVLDDVMLLTEIVITWIRAVIYLQSSFEGVARFWFCIYHFHPPSITYAAMHFSAHKSLLHIPFMHFILCRCYFATAAPTMSNEPLRFPPSIFIFCTALKTLLFLF